MIDIHMCAGVHITHVCLFWYSFTGKKLESNLNVYQLEKIYNTAY